MSKNVRGPIAYSGENMNHTLKALIILLSSSSSHSLPLPLFILSSSPLPSLYMPSPLVLFFSHLNMLCKNFTSWCCQIKSFCKALEELLHSSRDNFPRQMSSAGLGMRLNPLNNPGKPQAVFGLHHRLPLVPRV